VIEFKPNEIEKPTVRYNWSSADTDTMKSDISNVDWKHCLQSRAVEDRWMFFKDRINETVEKCVPKCGGRTKLKNPWMTREILRLIRRKRRKWREVKNSASNEEMRQYKQLEKETAKKIRNAWRRTWRTVTIRTTKSLPDT
jgi:hypothetical protein